MYVVLTTTPNAEEAESLAEKIVCEKLAACVQILPRVKSIYFWNDTVQIDDEHLLLIKTLPEKFADLEKFVQTVHSYETPEIIALETAGASAHYLAWMENYLR